MVLGQALAYAVMVPIAEVGRRLRAHRPGRGAGDARLLGCAPAQLAVPGDRGDLLVRGAGARRPRYAIQAIVVAMGGGKPPLVPIALGVALFHATLAVLGFDVMRWLLRVVLPISLAFVARDGRALRVARTTRGSTSAASSTRPTST